MICHDRIESFGCCCSRDTECVAGTAGRQSVCGGLGRREAGVQAVLDDPLAIATRVLLRGDWCRRSALGGRRLAVVDTAADVTDAQAVIRVRQWWCSVIWGDGMAGSVDRRFRQDGVGDGVAQRSQRHRLHQNARALVFCQFLAVL